MPHTDDLPLLKDCLDGKPGAWEAFVARFAPHLSAVCRRTLARAGRPAGDQEVDDMVQEVLLLLLEQDRRALRDYRGKIPLAGYLAVLAVHRVLRSRPPPRPAPALEPCDPAPGPLEAAQARELLALLQGGVSELPSQARLALALWCNGTSVKEVGQALGISEDAASRLLAGARERLRSRLPRP